MSSAEFWLKPGIWIATLGGLFMAFNAVRSLTSPVSFARYLGLPLAHDEDAGMVRIYGLRALFIAILAAALLITQNVPAITALMFSAAIMPVGDAYLTAKASAPRATVIRHLVIAIVLVAAGVLLVMS